MDWVSVFDFRPSDLSIILVRTVIVYFALLLGLRLAGKRELGQMTPFDLVVLLVIANAVQNAMVGPDTSLTGGIVAAFGLLAINWVMNRTALRWDWLRREITGTPTLLINNGQFVMEHLRTEGIQREEVMTALREHGISDPAQVEMAVLEVDGSISVVPVGAEMKRTRHRLHGRKTTGR